MINDVKPEQCERQSSTAAPSQFLDQTIMFWEGLATELIGIIGDGGFRMLFARSISLAKVKFPWLENFRFPHKGESQFLHFKACFAGRDINEMRDANAMILSVFVATLSSLVGDTLTTYILRPAWDQRRPPNVNIGSRCFHRNAESVSK
jgi:hypothetical protein